MVFEIANGQEKNNRSYSDTRCGRYRVRSYHALAAISR